MVLAYGEGMNTFTIPSIPIAPELFDAMKLSLHEGESLASFVEAAVRHEVDRRGKLTPFVVRAMANIRRTVATNSGVSAEVLLARLEAKLNQW